MSAEGPRCSIVIPSYCRGAVVLASLQALLGLDEPADEILVVDQTPEHSDDVEAALCALADRGSIRWLRLPRPSIPHAMNIGLTEAHGDFVLFLDDDIKPNSQLVAAHRRAQARHLLVAGMVLQPGQQPQALSPSEPFRFTSNAPSQIDEFMGGNFSIRRDVALALGGFDENFLGAGYRFEAEFAHRFTRKHGKIHYEPGAVVDHLQIVSGGTRAHGHHLRTLRPTHSVGAYYELLSTRRPGWVRKLLWRPLRAVRTRFHLRRPWWIPITLLAEFRGFVLALRLFLSGPRLLKSTT